MAAKDRLPPWHERHRLPNGRDVLVRPPRPDDAEPLRAAFDLLEPQRLRARLGGTATELPPAVAERLVRPNPRTDFVLVVADPEPPGEAVIAAMGHVHTDPAGHRGEFVVLVSAFVGGMGLGRYLLTRLAKWARSRHVDVLEGDLPADNPAMLELARTLGFRVLDPTGDPSLARVSLQVAS